MFGYKPILVPYSFQLRKFNGNQICCFYLKHHIDSQNNVSLESVTKSTSVLYSNTRVTKYACLTRISLRLTGFASQLKLLSHISHLN